MTIRCLDSLVTESLATFNMNIASQWNRRNMTGNMKKDTKGHFKET